MPLNVIFANAPLNELICGIQFDISGFNFVIENDFYSRIKSNFPKIKENPPLPFTFDKYSSSSIRQEKRLPFLKRYFFISESESKLIQLQEGRYLFNWRMLEGVETEYPRFKSVYKEFYENWEILKSIFNSHSLKFNVNQLELSYIDHIYVDKFEIPIGKIDEVFTFFNSVSNLARLDYIDFNFALPVPELKGHLNLKLSTATRNIDKKELLVFDMTLRGMLSEENDPLDNWFTTAHDIIIREFLNLITEKSKEIWGLVNESR